IQGFYGKIKDVNGINHPIQLASLEWNIAPVKDKRFSQFQHALMQAEMLGQFIEGGLSMACIWPGTWTRGDIQDNFRTVLDQEQHKQTSTFEMMKLYSNILGQQLIGSATSQPHVRPVCALSRDGKTLWVYLLHKSGEGKTIKANIVVNGYIATHAEAISLTAPSLSAIENGSKYPINVSQLKKLTIETTDNGKWQTTLPPHSLTMLQFHVH
ncbi:MAG TPA: hypothetical protein VIJ25_12355, partial [Methylococcales bacterium]